MKVYDIQNAGPNHRFLIRNSKGQQLLVSNCTQAVAADIMAHGAVNAERKGFTIWGLIHDQALAQAKGKLDDFVAALTELPPWAAGLPIKAEGRITPSYQKV